MKTKVTRIWWVIAAALLLATQAGAEATAYAQIVNERDQILSQILAAREAQYSVGATDGTAVFAARLALWTFRRDNAATREEKIRQQQLIVAEWEKQVEQVQVRARAGLATNEDGLIARDHWLEAKQTLEALREGERAG